MEKQGYTNQVLEGYLSASELAAEDKRLVTEIVNGSVRWLVRLDWVLNRLLKKPISQLNPWLRNILRLSAYQLLFMQRMPAHAVVNEAVELTKKKAQPGLAGLCNGVLRNLLRCREAIPDWIEGIRDPEEKASVTYAIPAWLLAMIRAAVPAEDLALVLDYANQPPPVTLRVNALRISREALQEELAQSGAEFSLDPQAPCGLRGQKGQGLRKAFAQGWFYTQSTASMLAAYILNSQPGDTVYDLCSGVGGKTTHIAEYMQNQGYIAALDLYGHKLGLLEENCRRLGIDIVDTVTLDALKAATVLTRLAQAVLLDAPCSGWGVLSRRPDLRHLQRREAIQELIQLQSRLLASAADLVKPGGVLLYATCTFNPEENQGQVQRFLGADARYQLEGFADSIAFFPLRPSDQAAAEQGSLTILPGIYQTDGMYYAKLRRRQ
jgi:16S rRNA (cytosine967-C5)-methyltransferase